MFKFTSRFLVKAAEEENLNGFSVIPLDVFVKSGSINITADGKEDADDKKDDKPEFGLGSKHRVVDDKEMGDYLQRIKTDAKEKHDPYNMPYIHKNNIQIVDGSGKEFDLAALKAQITTRPPKLLKKNEKMQHSDGKTFQYYNLGLPALKGLAVNENTGEFVIIDTCPGSGSCKTFCYAMKGSYVMFKNTSMMQTQTLNFLLNKPKAFQNRVKAEIAAAKALGSYNDEGETQTQIIIRWHDAGDFFSPQYLQLAFDIARAFPDIQFYAYTKMGEAAAGSKPDNFIISFSEGALPSEAKKVDLTKIKHSVVVPKEMFYDLVELLRNSRPAKGDDGQVIFKDEDSWLEFENRLVAKYKVNRKTLISYNDYMEKKRNGELGDTPNYWNVIVPPGGGDNSSNDNLVHGTYLLYH